MQYIACYFDSPFILDLSVTPIPGSGSSPLQVIASLPVNLGRVYVKDGVTGAFIGLYRGPIGFEKLACIVAGPGKTDEPAVFLKGDRISLRNMGPSTLTTGEFLVLFVGEA